MYIHFIFFNVIFVVILIIIMVSFFLANGTVPIESLSQETATASTYTLHTDNVPTDHPEQQQQQQHAGN